MHLPLASGGQFCSYAQAYLMIAASKILVFAPLLAALGGVAAAQTNYVTVTNFVTVTVTNVVIVTNAVSLPVTFSMPVVAAPGKPKGAWNNSISAGATVVRGNTDTTLITADYQAAKKTAKDEYAAMASAAYGEQNGVQTVDSYKGSFQWNHLFSERFYDYLRADGLHDYIANVNYRFTGGPGLGYYLLKQTNTALSVEGGVNYEAQELGDVNENFATVRLADKFEHRINDHARIWQTVEIFPEVDKWDNYVVNFEIGAEASFTKSLSLKAYVDDNYENEPALQHEKNDVRLMAGVAYKF
jgi:putative salt-induced outer membrane protein YdiY